MLPVMIPQIPVYALMVEENVIDQLKCHYGPGHHRPDCLPVQQCDGLGRVFRLLCFARNYSGDNRKTLRSGRAARLGLEKIAMLNCGGSQSAQFNGLGLVIPRPGRDRKAKETQRFGIGGAELKSPARGNNQTVPRFDRYRGI